ncbi:MAG: PAS domain-containing protein [Planctomycetota bacterium]|jgi:PAS domain S-box-containing protein
MQNTTPPTGVARTFGTDELIVTKTDLKGTIQYANRLFIDLAGYPEDELLGAPHSKIRHPEMPRCVFNLLWSRIQEGQEIFAYVVNLSSNGDHYWVFAHVTPSFDENGAVVGYHSNRRCPDDAAIQKVEALYKKLRAAERQAGDNLQSITVSTEMLEKELEQAGLSYDEFVFSL